ncbi:ribonuclease Z [Chitinophaga costaii]|uniref:Ribonuclease Z n=1 Tax=Chitinophaga costaii TaxID=1335309 RepID=A0A1C4DDD7_9BACT|nr:ribonuclease Z [Chitinophaga costaii]PUZ24575.1 ribonuclease Z [Chitinophaga costaii]SCC29379.1 ribonuclease Z [Chitinophaga costaii]
MFAVTILGNNSALPTLDRHPTAQVITCNDQLMLVDCGEGTQLQMARYKVRRSRIQRIFISHLHGDHYFGLIGFINTISLLGRTEPLFLYGPPALQAILQIQMDVANTTLNFELHFTPLTPEGAGILFREKDLEVSYFPTDHRIPCYGFRFDFVKHKRRINAEQARLYEVPSAYYSKLSEGLDYTRKDGTVVQNDWVTTAPPKGKSYVFCADTRYNEELLLPHISGADLVYHEATYLHDMETRAWERYHSTAFQAATLAAHGKVGRLLLGHFSSKYAEVEVFLTESRPVFPQTDIAREGVTYLV